MSNAIMEAVGHNGQFELTDEVLRIRRKGALAFLTQGLKGDKEILISQISSIQFKNASMLINGYMQIAFLGGQEGKRGIGQAGGDENTVMFRVGQQPAFLALRDELQKRMASSRDTGKSQISAMDELEKLASLRDRGVVSEEEFVKKKKALLGL